jgi:hypothetical protein
MITSVNITNELVIGWPPNDHDDGCPDHVLWHVVLNNDSLESQIIFTSENKEPAFDMYCKIKRILP